MNQKEKEKRRHALDNKEDTEQCMLGKETMTAKAAQDRSRVKKRGVGKEEKVESRWMYRINHAKKKQ